mgnify:CR=1 FL=1
MNRIKFNDIIFGKKYKIKHKNLAYPEEYYIGKAMYIDNRTITLQVKLSKKIIGSLGEPISYNIGINKNDIDCLEPTVVIYEWEDNINEWKNRKRK